MSSICPTCGKRVYFAERLAAAGKDYHKLCFKCHNCKKQLEITKFTERQGVVYCNPCYTQLFGQKGFGFGGSGGTLSSYRPGHATDSQLDQRPLADQQAEPDAPPSPSRAAPAGGAKFCSNCGSPCAGMKFCANCGNACQ